MFPYILGDQSLVHQNQRLHKVRSHNEVRFYKLSQVSFQERFHIKNNGRAHTKRRMQNTHAVKNNTAFMFHVHRIQKHESVTNSNPAENAS
jgi:Tfp pilus assembly protein PilE